MGNRVTKSALNLRSEIARLVGQFKSVVSGMTKGQAQGELEVSRENLIINGDMQVSQRGDYTSATAISANTYYLDRWSTYLSGVTGTVQDVTASQPDSLEDNHSSKYAATSTATGAIGGQQRLEEYLRYGGQTVTLSAWVKSNSTDAKLVLWDGTNFTSASYTGGGAWEKLTLTATIKSSPTLLRAYAVISNSSLGSVSITSGDYIEFTQVKLEIGDTATPFEVEPYADVLRKCQRYYQKSFEQNTAPGTATHIGGRHVTAWGDGNAPGFNFPTPMRAAPTVTLWPTNSTSQGYVNSFNTDRAASVFYPSETGISYIAITSGTANEYVRFQWVADSEL